MAQPQQPPRHPDEAWHAGRSSGNALMPHVPGAPARRTHVYVEHLNGLFVPQSEYEKVKLAEEQRKASLMMSGGQAVGGAGWGEREDAKNYVKTAERLRGLLDRVIKILGSWAFGFCAFQLLSAYSSDENSKAEVFLPQYSHFYLVEVKVMMGVLIFLCIFSQFPFAFELGTRRQRKSTVRAALASSQQEKNSRAGDDGVPPTEAAVIPMNASVLGISHDGQQQRINGSSEDPAAARNEAQRLKLIAILYGNVQASPLRHFANLRFVCFIGALVATIVEVSVIDSRTPEQVVALNDTLRSRLHTAIIIRAILLGLACIASAWSSDK